MTAIETHDWQDADVLRALEIYSADRLACFGVNHLNATRLEPWDKQFLRELKKALEIPKLTQDLRVRIIGAINLHYWNAGLCGAVYLVVQAAEVLYRNALSSAIGRHFGSPEWLLKPPKEMYTTGLLTDKDRKMILKARDAAYDKYYNLVRSPKYEPHHADVLAELDFGFWATLADTHPDGKASDSEKKRDELWARMIRRVIPKATREQRNRKQLIDWLTNAREVRNAVAHQHPIWASADELGLFEICRQKHTGGDKLVILFMRERRRLIYELINAIDERCGAITLHYDQFENALQALATVSKPGTVPPERSKPAGSTAIG